MSESDRSRVTTILTAVGEDPSIAEQLLPLVYEQLKQFAHNQLSKETPGVTLQPTALVHEAYLRLVENQNIRWDSRGHFFAAAARSMRQILVNRAHRRRAMKHGGGRQRLDLGEEMFVDEPPAERLLALDDALQPLEHVDARKGKIVLLRYFAGLSIEDTAKSLGLSEATVKRDWQFARTWLHREMNRDA